MTSVYRRRRSPHYLRGHRSKKTAQVRIPIERGKLTKFGYATSKSDGARHAALNKAIRKYGALSVYRKLNAQVVLRKSKQPEARKVFEEDAEWVKEEYSMNGFTT